MKISITDSAFNDLESIKKYYLEQGVPHIGENFIISIVDRVQTLTKHPNIGRVVPEFDEEHIREIIYPPFRIVYLLDRKLIQVVRIWRSERLLELPEEHS